MRFERFIDEKVNKTDLLKFLKIDTEYKLEQEKECTISLSKESNDIINKYHIFLSKIENGELGKIAQI